MFEELKDEILAAGRALGREIILGEERDYDFEAVFASFVDRQARAAIVAGRRGEVNAVFGLTANRLPPAAQRKMIPLGPRFGRVQWKTCQPFQRGRALPPEAYPVDSGPSICGRRGT